MSAESGADSAAETGSRAQAPAQASAETLARQGRRPGAIIVGASSGIGAALAPELVARGYQVALVARRGAEVEALAARLNASEDGASVARAYAHDARDTESATRVFTAIRADLGAAPLRLLVYAAGVLSPPAPEGQPFAGEREIVETNLLGAMRWLGLAGETLAQAGGGALVGVSSVAGDRGRAGNAAYMASKAGLTTYLESLRYRLARRGVRVVTVKPGYVATPMLAGAKPPRPLVISAAQAARRIAEVCERGPEVVYVPERWAFIMAVVRLLPAPLMKRLSI